MTTGRRIHFFSTAPPSLVDDIVDSYRLAAEELGHQTSFSRDTIMPGMLNILFFSWQVSWEAFSWLHPQCIVVNFEHLSDGAAWFLPSYREVLTKCYLWEYSETNFQRHRELNFYAADYVPLGYQRGAGPELALAAVLPENERDIDVVFFGALNDRRVKVLQALLDKGLVVHTPAGSPWTVEERDARLRRAKVVLNMHQFDDSRIVETPRLTVLFRNRKAVVCELYPDSELMSLWRDAVVGAPYDGLVDATLALLGDPAQRVELEAIGYQRLNCMDQKPICAAALARFDQWIEQQRGLSFGPNPSIDDSPRITVVLTVIDGAEGLALSLASLQQQQRLIEFKVLLITLGVRLCEADREASIGLRHLQHLELPAAVGQTATRNLGLTRAQGDYVVFLQAGDGATPDRLQRQATFLDAHPALDIAGSWLSHTGPQPGVLKPPELDHEIKAEFLESRSAFSLHSCMFRLPFLHRHSLRFDAQFEAHGEAHFLYRCAAANARFAAIPAALCELRSPANPQLSGIASDGGTRLATHARRDLLGAYFPQLTGHEVERLCELYSTQWPADLAFASNLLALIAKASESPAASLNLVPATIKRSLRHEALRLIRIFSEAALCEQDWVATQFSNPAKATLLAPIRHQIGMILK